MINRQKHFDTLVCQALCQDEIHDEMTDEVCDPFQILGMKNPFIQS